MSCADLLSILCASTPGTRRLLLFKGALVRQEFLELGVYLLLYAGEVLRGNAVVVVYAYQLALGLPQNVAHGIQIRGTNQLAELVAARLEVAAYQLPLSLHPLAYVELGPKAILARYVVCLELPLPELEGNGAQVGIGDVRLEYANYGAVAHEQHGAQGIRTVITKIQPLLFVATDVLDGKVVVDYLQVVELHVADYVAQDGLGTYACHVPRLSVKEEVLGHGGLDRECVVVEVYVLLRQAVYVAQIEHDGAGVERW